MGYATLREPVYTAGSKAKNKNKSIIGVSDAMAILDKIESALFPRILENRTVAEISRSCSYVSSDRDVHYAVTRDALITIPILHYGKPLELQDSITECIARHAERFSATHEVMTRELFAEREFESDVAAVYTHVCNVHLVPSHITTYVHANEFVECALLLPRPHDLGVLFSSGIHFKGIAIYGVVRYVYFGDFNVD